MRGRRAALGLLLPVAAGIAGCESTQTKSERLRGSAIDRPAEKGLAITEESRDVRVVRASALQDNLGAAVVVELRNRSDRPQAGLPVAFSVKGAGGKALFANDAPGLDSSLVEVPLLPARGKLLWVNDQVRLSGAARRVTAKVGASRKPAPGALPEIKVIGARLVADPGGGHAAVGEVRNASDVEQRRLVVHVTGMRGGRLVAAGRAIVRRLKPGAKAKFIAFLAGAAKGATLQLSAPPTTLGSP